MKLVDLIKQIDTVDEDLIIFLENIADNQSEILLAFAETDDSGIKEVDGIKYYYLIEVSLAKEFIHDWLNSIELSPTTEEIAAHLYMYTMNDA